MSFTKKLLICKAVGGKSEQMCLKNPWRWNVYGILAQLRAQAAHWREAPPIGMRRHSHYSKD